MMIKRYFATISLFALLLAGCGDAKAAPTGGEAQGFSVACDKVNDGKRITVEGYLRLPDTFKAEGSVVLTLFETTDFQGKPIGVQIDFGSQANQIDTVPMEFSDDDLNVHLADGQLAPFGTKVKVSGKVYYPLVSQVFTCALENPLVELAN